MTPEKRIVFQSEWNKEKKERHLDNLARFTGFWHGKFQGGTKTMEIFKDRQLKKYGSNSRESSHI